MSSDVAAVNLLDRPFYAGDPYPALAALRATEPVYFDERTQLWALLLHEDVCRAEKQPELFSSAPGSRPHTPPQASMIDSDDPQHTRRRRLVYSGFTPRHIAAWEPHVRELVTQLIDAVAARGACDLVADLAAPLPMIVIAEMLGVRPEDRDTLQHWSDTLISAADGPEHVSDEVLHTAAEFYTYARDVIAARRRQPRDDLISTLVHASIDGQSLTEEELLAESLLLLIGGNETTRNVISGGMEALMRHPAQRDMLVADPSRIPVAVEECLRWVTPIINMARTTTADVEMRGRTIPAGAEVLLMYISANRDERVFDRPDVFDVTRDPNPHIAFGLGTHFCLGASLARLEVRVMFSELLRRLPDMRLADPDASVARTPSSFIRGIPSLPVTFTPER